MSNARSRILVQGKRVEFWALCALSTQCLGQCINCLLCLISVSFNDGNVPERGHCQPNCYFNLDSHQKGRIHGLHLQCYTSHTHTTCNGVQADPTASLPQPGKAACQGGMNGGHSPPKSASPSLPLPSLPVTSIIAASGLVLLPCPYASHLPGQRSINIAHILSALQSHWSRLLRTGVQPKEVNHRSSA